MAIAYWTVAGITFSIILSAFLRDRAARKASLKAWAFIAVATLLWPVTLPFIISSKLRNAQARRSPSNDCQSQDCQSEDCQSQARKKDTSLMTMLQTAPAAGDS
ncbi:MAG: hypothetical protein AAF703_02480 [Cyanobacteria bacterium P01_D01_bin.105]